jgi:hypothetical protein
MVGDGDRFVPLAKREFPGDDEPPWSEKAVVEPRAGIKDR